VALKRLGIADMAMEYYVAESERPLERCMHDVMGCDLYIGIFAWRYGYIPDGEKRSITESEYRTAIEHGKPVLIFLLSEDASWPRRSMDPDATRIEALRAELSANHTCMFFSTPQELATMVTASVHNQLTGQGKSLPGGEYLSQQVIRDYYERIIQQYGRLDLETLTPSQFEDQLRIQLNSVFVEPDVRTELPVLDLPKDLQEYLAAQEKSGQASLPKGLTPEELDRLRRAYQQRPRRRVFDLLGGQARQCVVLLGDPGAGKSTLLRYLALSLADPAVSVLRTPFAHYLPIIIELKAYESARTAEQCATFLDFFDRLACSEGLGLDKAAVHQYLTGDGRAVALFDGLDEIFEPAHRAEVSRQIAAFAARYPKISVVVTSRIIGYSRGVLADAGFTHATIQDLNLGQIGDFLSGWYALALHDRPADAAQRKDRLLAAIADSRSISEMAGNPLLLTILAIIGRHQVLPRERWKVYDYAATVLVERWDLNRHLSDAQLPIGFIGEDDKKELLRRIAWLMQAGAGHGGNYLTGEVLKRELENYLRERFKSTPQDAASLARAIIRQFHERNFILSYYGGDLYGFVHRAFLEFFCAEAFRWQFEKNREIDVQHLQIEVFGRHWDDPAWREVLRLIAGTIHEQHAAKIIIFLTDTINASWPWKFGDSPPRNIALAAQCLAEKRAIGDLDQAARRVLVRVIQLIEHCVLDEDRPSCALLANEILPAIAAIGQAWPGRETYLDWYLARGIRIVWSPVSSLASRIAVSLYPDEPRLFRAFLDSIRTITDSRLRVPLLERLDKYLPADAGIVAELLGNTGHDPDNRVREAAVRALAARPADPEVRRLLFDRATRDDDSDIRESAVRALAGLPDDPDVRAFLLGRAAEDESWAVRQAAVRALAGLPMAEDIREVLLDRAIRDGDNRVRESAAEALAGLPADTDIRTVLLGRAAETGARETALRALAGLPPDVDGRGMLMDRAAGAASGAVRQAAVQALADHAGDPGVRVLLLVTAADDVDDQVREAAVRALGPVATDPEVCAFLLARSVSDGDDQVRVQAVKALAARPAEADVRALLLDRAVQDSHDQVRAAAVQALRGLPADADVRALLLDRAVQDSDHLVRSAALGALARSPAEPPIRALLLDRAVQDSDAKVRMQAVTALAHQPAGADVRALLLDRAVQDSDNEARRAAVEALAAWPGDPGIRALLIDRAATDQAWAVRQAAVDTLSAWPVDPDIRALLLGLAAQDDDNDVREAAIRALARIRPDQGVRARLLDRADDSDANVRDAAVKALAKLPADADIRVLLLDRAAHSGTRKSALLDGQLTEPGVRDLLLDRAARASVRAVRQAAVRLLARLPVDAGIRALLLDRAVQDSDTKVREAAVRALGNQPVGPEVRDFLFDRAAHDSEEAVWQTALDVILSANSDDAVAKFAVAKFIVSNRANDLDTNWARQLWVRIVSCSAEFDPGALPSIADGSSWP
jgi:HEAT repeat protein